MVAPAPPALPLTVVGGFLGAGKTTLVNHLLATATGPVAVLVNDFGAVNIDAALVASRAGTTIALSNGCICCSLGDDAADTLAAMAARHPRPRHVVVEASGISDPWRIAQAALTGPDYDLQPLVVLVDAAAVLAQIADPLVAPTITRQLAFAELVVLNKCDLAPDLAAVTAAIAALRPQARLVAVAHGHVPQAAFRFAPPPRPAASRFQADQPHPFRSWHWRCPGPLDRDRLRGVLAALPPSVLRVKGCCALGPEAAPHLLQYAAERWALTPTDAALPPGFVVIGTTGMPGPVTLAASFRESLCAPP